MIIVSKRDLSIPVTYIIFLIYLCNAQDPTVKITSTEPASYKNSIITAVQGADVTMDCYVENLPVGNTVQWQVTASNAARTVRNIAKDMALEDNIHFALEKPTQFTWRLRIRSILSSDDGNYMCLVQLHENSRVFDNRTIRVQAPPYLDLEQTSSDMTVSEGEDVVLQCNATARPTPMIEWTRLGNALLPVGIGKEHHLGSILKISSIKAKDRGVYRCTVWNSIGTVVREVEVNVLFKPEFTKTDDTVSQAVGYRIELQCNAEANPFPHAEQLSWIKGATTYSYSTNRYEVKLLEGAFSRLTYELILKNVQEEDYGTYMCRISNDVGNSMQRITLIKSNTPQPSTKLGRVIRGNEDPYGKSSALKADSLFIYLFFVLVCFYVHH